jgi:hypothetical protein
MACVATFLRVLVLTLSCLLGVSSVAGAQTRVVAVADQNPQMFSDPLWRSLGISHARVAAPWDLATTAVDTRTVAWLDAARDAGVNALVTWTPSGGRLPSRARFRAAFIAFHHRWPNVYEFGTWNEPNLRGQATASHPALLAGYWKVMRDVCRSCTVLAPELVDFESAPRWAQRFEAAVHRRGITWGLHNYRDANRFRPIRRSVTAAFLRAVKGPVWLTETGGLVRLRKSFARSEARADRATRYMFSLADFYRGRIPRIYLYHWRAPANDTLPWDSGLLSFAGRPRPAFWTFAKRVGALQAARAALAGTGAPAG